jgi:hypothetical protein
MALHMTLHIEKEANPAGLPLFMSIALSIAQPKKKSSTFEPAEDCLL